MNLHDSPALKRRAEYTHQYNSRTGRHGWLRLTPAFSVKIVEELLSLYARPVRVLDPFCGTGTTALCAAHHGLEAVTIDINPFLVWFARAKTARYSAASMASAESAGVEAAELASQNRVDPAPEPKIYQIDRWWTSSARQFLCRLKAAIECVVDAGEPAANLLHVSFCRTLIQLSNAAFNHQSMSFHDESQRKLEIGVDYKAMFLENLTLILKGAKENPQAAPQVEQGDARNLSEQLYGRFDVVITSPPYANRMSYIRELRPYMYWLNYLTDRKSAGELDWAAIGGTWGSATSRLRQWRPSGGCRLPSELSEAIECISSGDNPNGALLANYVAKYCEDMSNHFDALRSVLNPGACLHYIVGNSTFYGTLVSTEQMYASTLRAYGFENVTLRPIRKRNSKKELIEFLVSAVWPRRSTGIHETDAPM